MAEETPKDPSAVFMDWVGQWERAADKFSNQFMATEEFSQSMNAMQKIQMEYQRAFAEQMTKQLANMNMPSRDELLQLSETVREMDRKISRIDANIERLVAGQTQGSTATATKRPARTKKPPAKKAAKKDS